MKILDLLPSAITYRRAGTKNGGEYQGSCPWCGDGGKGLRSDRFHVWPEQGRNGTYWCRACGKAGDAIKYLIDHDGLQFKEALNRLGLDPAILGPRAEKPPVGWQPSAATTPAEIWVEKAEKFAAWCHDRLLERPLDLAWLAERGIAMEMVEKYRLGYNPAHAWREGSAWGLTLERKADGKLKKLWLPRGLVIPKFSETGKVQRLRIRQPDGEPRYYVVPGSSREPLCSRPAEAMIIVESELDAILLDGLAGDLAGFVAMGNDSAKPTAALHSILQEALYLGVSLDSDTPRYNPETGLIEMAGPKSSLWWLQHFDRARRLPIVGGKDPGDAFKAGVDLRLWLLAALPPYFQIKGELDAEKARAKETRLAMQAMEQDLADTAGLHHQPPPEAPITQEAREAASEPPPAEPTSQPADQVKTVTLKNGRSFCLAASRDEWEKLTAEGRIVFSEHELARLQAACKNMNQEERLAAAMLALDMKELFAPAWISRGEAISLEEIGEQP